MARSKFAKILSTAVLSWLAVFSVLALGRAFCAGRPNVLFIIMDTTRSDHLGCYGYDMIKTPNIDSLAGRGVRFKTVISQAPLTFASHCTIFTSTYPQFHKARDNGSFRLDDSAVTMAEVLRDNGYTTAAFVSTVVLDSKYTLKQGFQTYDDKMDKVPGKRVIKFMDDKRRADKVTAAAVDWLKNNHDKKFFLWVHYYDPHSVYNPPSPYKEIYKDNLYDGEIAYADEYIGALLKALKDLKVDKNTLIVFAADHGESLGEHGENGHAVFIYDTTLKVPLIFCYPAEIPQAKVVGGQVRLIDIMPTLLDLLNIKKNKEIQGTSLIRYIKGNEKDPELPAYSESLYAKYHFNWSELHSWREKEWKYIQSTEPELYNIQTDPGEMVNLADEKPQIVEKLDKELKKFLEQTSAKGLKENKMALDEQTKEKLMSLGYIQGGVEAKGAVPIKMIQVMEKLNLADRQANEGLIEQAIEGYNDILKADPNNMEANLHLGQCYKETGKYDIAIKYFKKAAYFKPDEPEAHDGLGNIYKSMGKVKEAFDEFQIAAVLDPDNPVILNNIGWCYQQTLDFDKAMEYYHKALALDNNLATAHANMAICYRVRGKMDKALEELDIALKEDPELAFAHSELCACIASKGDVSGAIAHCQKAIELDPQGFDGYNNLAVCYEMEGQYDKAIENYNKALEISPWSVLAHCNIANSYIQRKEFDKAKEHLKKALELQPGNQKALHLLSTIP
jgi:choline-sulfatase